MQSPRTFSVSQTREVSLNRVNLTQRSFSPAHTRVEADTNTIINSLRKAEVQALCSRKESPLACSAKNTICVQAFDTKDRLVG